MSLLVEQLKHIVVVVCLHDYAQFVVNAVVNVDMKAVCMQADNIMALGFKQ